MTLIFETPDGHTRLYRARAEAFVPTLEADSIDACVTDPPYELNFMGRGWDRTGIAYSVDLWRSVLRAMKPGAYLLAFGAPRTYHRLACAIEDAGFEIRDCVQWWFGSGFPKSLDVSKAIDDAAGADRPVLGPHPSPQSTAPKRAMGDGWQPTPMLTAPATDAARQWDGWGTALKPAYEPIVCARKPLRGTVAVNVQRYGTGALNIDAARIAGAPPSVPQPAFGSPTGRVYGFQAGEGRNGEYSTASGRWPSNVLLSHADGCEPRGTRRVKAHGSVSGQEPSTPATNVYGDYSRTPFAAYGDGDGLETVEAWDCAPGCPVAELDRQSGVLHARGNRTPTKRGAHVASAYMIAGPDGPIDPSDAGGASRFFYVAKADRGERDAGCEHLPARSAGEIVHRAEGSAGTRSPRAGAGRTSGGRNTHPTVKPLDLMDYLIKLVTPPRGTVLDPFMGSGSTGCSAARLGYRFIGCDEDEESCAIARARITYWKGPLFAL